MKTLHMIAFGLLIIGGLNWLLVGLFEFDLVAEIFGGMDSIISKIIYILVGVSAAYIAATHRSDCRTCGSQKMASSTPPAQAGM